MGVTSNPYISAQLLPAEGQLLLDPWRVLIIGQIGTDGNAVDGQAYDNIERITESEVEYLFGTKSEMTGRILRSRRECNGQFSIWAIGLDAAVGTAATFTHTVVGTATEDRTLTVKAIDEFLYTFTVDIVTGDDADTVAGKIKAEYDALVRFPATTGSVLTGAFTLTANDVGTIPNKYTVKVSNIAAGLTITEGQFSSGATDPSTTGIFDVVSATRFHTILWPYESDFTEVQDFLEARNIISNSFLHGVALIGYDDTEANITAKVNGTTPLNSPNLLFIGNRKVSSVSAFITPPDWRCAEFATIEGLRQTDGAPIGRFVTVNSARDTVGNAGLASLAYYNTPLALTDIPNPELLFDSQEQENLISDGYSIIGVNESKTSAITGQMVSTYKFNSRGEDDVSFKYLNYIRTGYLALEVFYRTLKSDYSQFRITDGDIVAGRAIANKEQIEGNFFRIYQLLSGPAYTLTQAGSLAQQFFADNLTITVDIANGIITSSGKLPIVTQVRRFNITFNLSFSIGGE